jgi:hypothetical protein
MTGCTTCEELLIENHDLEGQLEAQREFRVAEGKRLREIIKGSHAELEAAQREAESEGKVHAMWQERAAAERTKREAAERRNEDAHRIFWGWAEEQRKWGAQLEAAQRETHLIARDANRLNDELEAERTKREEAEELARGLTEAFRERLNALTVESQKYQNEADDWEVRATNAERRLSEALAMLAEFLEFEGDDYWQDWKQRARAVLASQTEAGE